MSLDNDGLQLIVARVRLRVYPVDGGVPVFEGIVDCAADGRVDVGQYVHAAKLSEYRVEIDPVQ